MGNFQKFLLKINIPFFTYTRALILLYTFVNKRNVLFRGFYCQLGFTKNNSNVLQNTLVLEKIKLYSLVADIHTKVDIYDEYIGNLGVFKRIYFAFRDLYWL